MNILVVDDSIVFRSQISASLQGIEDVTVIGTAANGKIAIQKLQQLSVDLITLDMEMPELNGLQTIAEIKRLGFKVKIIVFSSQTTRGAELALEALRLGADEVVAKPTGDQLNFETAFNNVRLSLLPIIHQFKLRQDEGQIPRVAKSLSVLTTTSASAQGVASEYLERKNLDLFFPKAIVIASSTGGPSVLDRIFSAIKPPCLRPIFIVQHMPPVFTQILAKRIQEVSGIEAREAIHDELVLPNCIYVAPGGFHLSLEKQISGIKIKLDEGPARNSVRPAADYLFESAAEIFGASLVGIVLTGMGEDGAQGAQAIRKKGGGIIIQSKESCVVFGMPGAVFSNNDYDKIMSPHQVSNYLNTVIK